MAEVEEWMSLYLWDLQNDLYDYGQQAGNLVKIGSHNHTPGQGRQIPNGGLEPGSVTAEQIASGTITNVQIANGTITDTQIAEATITVDKIAPNNLPWEWVPAGISGPIAAGTFVNATSSSITLTLPIPTLGDSAGVLAGANTVSGSSPITINTSSGLIYGVGCSGVSSVTLGVEDAALTFEADGTNWNIVSGQQDSGWVPVTLLSGWTAGSAYAPALRLQGDRVWGRGSASSGIGSSTPFSVPSGLRPAEQVQILMFTTTSATIVGTLTTGGTMTLAGSEALIVLDPIQYSFV